MSSGGVQGAEDCAFPLTCLTGTQVKVLTKTHNSHTLLYTLVLLKAQNIESFMPETEGRIGLKETHACISFS